MDDIARLANVSKPTVSRALRDSPNVLPDTKKRVLEVAKKYGYAVNRNAQKLRHKRLDTIAVVLDFPSLHEKRISDPFIFELLGGVAEALAVREQDLLLCSPHLDDAGSYRTILSSKGADGLVFLGQGRREAALRELAEAGAPFVVWGAVTDDAPYCVVGSDNHLGGMLAGRHIASRDRRRVLFIGDTAHMEIKLRRDGLVAALDEDAPGYSIADIAIGDFAYDTSFAAVSSFIAQAADLPDAVFACSDSCAMATINAFREAGLNAPEDISVVGYNDIPEGAHFFPPLTTIRQDVHMAGSLLVERLMQALDGSTARSIKLNTELVVRGSS